MRTTRKSRFNWLSCTKTKILLFLSESVQSRHKSDCSWGCNKQKIACLTSVLWGKTPTIRQILQKHNLESFQLARLECHLKHLRLFCAWLIFGLTWNLSVVVRCRTGVCRGLTQNKDKMLRYCSSIKTTDIHKTECLVQKTSVSNADNKHSDYVYMHSLIELCSKSVFFLSNRTSLLVPLPMKLRNLINDGNVFFSRTLGGILSLFSVLIFDLPISLHNNETIEASYNTGLYYIYTGL